MRIVRDEIPLCEDCTIAAVNGDFTGLDYHYGSNWTCQTCARKGTGRAPDRCPSCDSERDATHGPRSDADARMAEIEAGLAKLAPHLVPSHDSESGRGINEFSRRPCGCCGTTLAGSRHEFSILGGMVLMEATNVSNIVTNHDGSRQCDCKRCVRSDPARFAGNRSGDHVRLRFAARGGRTIHLASRSTVDAFCGADVGHALGKITGAPNAVTALHFCKRCVSPEAVGIAMGLVAFVTWAASISDDEPVSSCGRCGDEYTGEDCPCTSPPSERPAKPLVHKREWPADTNAPCGARISRQSNDSDVTASAARRVCPNCDQWQNPTSRGYHDCSHECALRGFAERAP